MLRSPGARFFLVAFCMQLAVRWVLIDTYPNNYSMDAYQRWGGREHLLIQGWLPVTQFFVWLTATLGGGILAMRVVMAIVGALAVATGGWTARLMAGPAAGWLFMPIGLFGPFLTWSVVPYQEGTFLLVLFGGLGLALRAQAQPESTRRQAWLIADVAAGLLPLVRYEGWPVTLLYILWRRQPQAWVASWGAWLWIIIKLMGVQSNASSPIDYADWEGLDTRFEPAVLQASLSKMWKQMLDTKGAFVLMTGLVAWIHLARVRRPWIFWLGLVTLGQLAALAGWLIGLETATYRMQAVPGVLFGLFVACSAGLLWHQVNLAGRCTIALLAVFAAGSFTQQGFNNSKRSTRSVRWESRLVETMNECEECRYLIRPRKRIGTRDRHDGCEIIQGLSMALHGEKFWCQKWGKVPAEFDATHAVRWRKGGYVIRDARDTDRQQK